MTTKPPTVLFVCTGNAARSVMATALMRAATDQVQVASAGTHSIPDLPMSVRTRAALDHAGVADPDHRSTQLDTALAEQASVIAVFEPMHVAWVRRQIPQVADRTASLPRLARDLASGPVDTLASRVSDLGLAGVEWEPWEEVVDPAGGDIADFIDAITAIEASMGDFIARVVG